MTGEVSVRFEPERRSEDIEWAVLSSHGRVLFYIALCPGATVSEISRALGLTMRQVWNIVRNLRTAEMLKVDHKGRRHHFSVRLDAPFLHPTIEGIKVEEVLGRIARTSPEERAAICESEECEAD